MDPFTRPPIFAAFAGLLRPADDTIPWTVVEVGPDWASTAGPGPGVDAVTWGRMPVRGRPSPGTVFQAIRREIAYAAIRARPPAGLHVVAAQRLPPVRRPGRLRQAVRTATMSGAVVELARADRPERRIDRVAARAGALAAPRLRPSGDGSALARLSVAGLGDVELRVAVAGHAKDPLHGRAALEALASAGVPLVPRPVDGDETAGVRWATETVVVGEHPRVLDGALANAVVELLAQLPAGGPGPASLHERLTRLAVIFPRHGDVLVAAMAAATDWADGLPTVLEHGDVWLNNLLVADGRLAGLIDWDTWHPSGIAGADVLSLIAQDERSRTRQDLGELFVDRFWERPAARDAVAAYARARGFGEPGRAGRAVMAVGWWATATTSAIDRALRPATDPAWVRRNVDGPVATLERLLDDLR